MTAMPSQDQLIQAQGAHFTLWVDAEHVLDVELLEVLPGAPMSSRHECFSAFFGLPPGIALPQNSYRLAPSGEEEGWLLLLTPSPPEADGRHVLQAVFHMEKPV